MRYNLIITKKGLVLDSEVTDISILFSSDNESRIASIARSLKECESPATVQIKIFDTTTNRVIVVV